jgi:hypothetical protein
MASASSKRHLVLLSTSDIKTKIISEVFGSLFELHFVKVPDNPGRPTQPLFIRGTVDACSTRFDEYFEKYKLDELPDDTIVISIENGILSLDLDELKPWNELMWADFCVIGSVTHGDPDKRTFVISPEVIAIDQSYSWEYFAKGETHPEFDTLGKLIATRYNAKNGSSIPDNNWMKTVAQIDRIDQIRKGLIEVKAKLLT